MSARDLPTVEVPGRAIRVFISSTFRDMHGERDELVKRVFPQIRKLCESRGVSWTEVDLRWGVTEEQKAEGNVLGVCLSEIKNCRPFFIGLIGERYGWVPDEIPSNLIEAEPWLETHRGYSVTDLEILHGVLNDPDMAGHAFFYLRDPRYLDRLPRGVDRADFMSEGPASAQKLTNLKDRIRSSGFPVREDYRDPHELADFVLSDLQSTVDRLYPEGSQPDPLDREFAEHEAFASSRARVYIAREADFRAIEEHIQGNGSPLVVLGESGSGKSALLANWALQRRERERDEVLLTHFVGATPESGEIGLLLRRLAGELKRRCELPREIPDRTDLLRAEFRDWLSAVAEKKRVVLVIDALNQIEDTAGIADLSWLPEKLPQGVRLIVSTLAGPQNDEVVRRGWPALNVEPLQITEREALVIKYLGQYSKALSPARVRRIVECPAAANPLYLRAVLEELRLFGVHEQLDERLEFYLSATDPASLLEKVLARYETDYESDRPGLVGDAMSLLGTARRGLSEVELLDLLGKNGKPLPRAFWAPLALAAEMMLVNRSGLLRFSHDYAREAVLRKYLPKPRDRRRLHRRLADHFEQREIGRRRITIRRWLPIAMLLALMVAIMAGGGWLLMSIDEESRKTAFERGLLIAPAVVTSVVAAALSLWLVWGFAKILNGGGRHLRLHGPKRRRPEKSGHEEARSEDDASVRCVDELPWHLARARAWWRLYDLLRTPSFFRKAWAIDSTSILAAWREVETGTYGPIGRLVSQTRELDSAFRDLFGGRSVDAYQRIMFNPVGHRTLAAPVAQFLIESGRHHEAGTLVDRLVRHDERSDRSARLASALILQADGFRAKGYSVATIAGYKRAERFCSETDDPSLRSRCLEGRAHIALERNDPETALSLALDSERLARLGGDPSVLAHALVSRAKARHVLGAREEALRDLEEAEILYRALGNRAELARLIDERRTIFIDAGDLGAAQQAARQASSLRAELGIADPPNPAPTPLELLDERLNALRLDEHEYRRSGRKVLLAQALVEQSYHWAVLRQFPVAAKPLAAEASHLASQRGLDDLMVEFQPVLDMTAEPVDELQSDTTVIARPAIVAPLLKALASGALAAFLLFTAAKLGWQAIANLQAPDFITLFCLFSGIVMAALTGRSIHSLIARPYVLATPAGLAIRQWTELDSSIYRILEQLFSPIRRIRHVAIPWSEFQQVRVTSVSGGLSKAVFIDTAAGEISLGSIFRERPKQFAARVDAAFQNAIARGLASSAANPDQFRDLSARRTSLMAVASLLFGIGLPVLGALPAILFGHLALRAIRRSDEKLAGRKLARYGLIFGYANLLLFCVLLLAVLSSNLKS